MIPETKEQIEWMHPSWRDLLIDHLSKNRKERRNFIKNCGINGILLGLSISGGGEGQRFLPILIDHEDWEIFTEKVSLFLQLSQKYHDSRIFEGIFIAVEHFRETKLEISPEPLKNLTNLAKRLIEVSESKWKKDNVLISNNLLRSYLGLAEIFSFQVSSEYLNYLYASLLEEIEPLVESSFNDPDELSEYFEEFTEFVSIIKKCRLESISKMDLYGDLEGHIISVLEKIEECLDEYWEVDSEDDYYTRSDSLDHFKKSYREVASFFSKDYACLPSIKFSFKKKEEELEDKFNELRIYENDDDTVEEDRNYGEEINIDVLFSDL